jgi:putative ATP-dependent endonuclease of the OLD family
VETTPIAEEESSDQNNEADFSAVYVERIHIRDFRGIRNCVICFEPDLTLLVGCNNVGKSRIMRAMAVALGAVPADRDDLTVSGADTATVDVVISPKGAEEDADDVFDARVTRRLGYVQPLSEEPAHERFAWRTTIRLSQEGFGVRTDHNLLTYDTASNGWLEHSNSMSATYEQRSIVSADLIESRRDLVDELTRRASPIRRILDDLEIAADRRTALEQSLQGLGGEIVSSSKSLAAVKKALEVLSKAVDTMGVPSLQPVPVRLEELARSVSIDLDTGSGGLPIRLHGAGVRSLTSLQVQSVLYDRRLGKDGPALRPHPVSLIEEPEAHLHPQAQFELPTLLDQISGQTIVSTHSAHLVSVVEPRCIRVVQRIDAAMRIVDLGITTDNADPIRARRPSAHIEELEKLKRLVERPFGELLFSSAILLGDGATERALLPPILRHVFDERVHGLCVVDPGSMASDHAIAIVKFAKLVMVPWLLFSDSDSSGRTAAMRLVNDHGGGDMDRIVWVPAECTSSASGKSGGATERMFLDFDEDLCKAACTQLGWDSKTVDLLSFMCSSKGTIGRFLAAELVLRYPWDATKANWPPALCDLVAKLGRILPA